MWMYVYEPNERKYYNKRKKHLHRQPAVANHNTTGKKKNFT